LTVPPEDEKNRDQYFDELQRQTQRVSVDHVGQRVSCQLFCIVPSEDVGQRIEEELQQYWTAAAVAPAIPPWSPSWQHSPQIEAWRKARQTLQKLMHGPVEGYQSPELKEVNQKLIRAATRGKTSDQLNLQKRQHQLIRELQLKQFKDLRALGPVKVDQEVIDQYVEWWKTSKEKEKFDGAEDREPLAVKLPQKLTERLGLLPGREKSVTPDSGSWGYVQRSALYVSLVFTPVQIDPDLFRLAEWLYAQGAVQLTYSCMLGAAEEEGGLPD
jgi:hypothetical protein